MNRFNMSGYIPTSFIYNTRYSVSYNCIFVMFLVKDIVRYVLKWERSELEKFSAKKFNDLSNY
jgi:hypothetical protein